MCRRCEHTSEPLTYRCHAGLHESVMPILVDQKLLGYAMIGQFRMGNAGEEKTAISPDLLAQAKKAGIEAEALREAYLKLPVHNESLTQNMVNLFAALINFIVLGDYINARQPGLAEKISHWIDDHLSEPIMLDDAASAMGYSRSTVCHTIKKRFGVSFKQLCILKRIQRFENIIAGSPALTIGQAALKVGYDDPLYFSRIYKKTRLIAPTTYIKLIRKTEGIADP
jgi:AraC-like DNA-binding protein